MARRHGGAHAIARHVRPVALLAAALVHGAAGVSPPVGKGVAKAATARDAAGLAPYYERGALQVSETRAPAGVAADAAALAQLQAELEEALAKVRAMGIRQPTNENAGTERMKHEHHFAVDWLVMVPLIILVATIYSVWRKIPTVKEENEYSVWTATDQDLREVDIAEVGASGVALLRRHSDRKLAIMLAVGGMILQLSFLYFLVCDTWEHVLRENVRDAPTVLIFCSMFCNCMFSFHSLIRGMKAWDTRAPESYETLHQLFVIIDSFFLPIILIIVGCFYLCTSKDISALVFNSTSMAFVTGIPIKIASMMSWSLSGHGGRAFQPAKVNIKDSTNSLRYSYFSVLWSIVISVVMVPISRYVFHV